MRSNQHNQSHFSAAPAVSHPRSAFNRSHGRKGTFRAGFITPILVDEALPGDTINLSAEIFARLATPLHPIMDNIHLETFYFSVPYRLVWENWQRFCGEQDNPDDSVDFLIPQITSGPTGYTVNTIQDHMGLPIGNEITHSALWFRAYNLIYNEFFRDQNLQDSVPVHRDDGPDPVTDYTMLRRGKRHDYFTSCLPFVQKGPAVEIPLGTSAPGVVDPFSENHLVIPGAIPVPTFQLEGGGPVVTLLGAAGDPNAQWSENPGIGNMEVVHPGSRAEINNDGLGWTTTTDLTQASAVTINALREASAIQRLFETDARGGTRYTEIIRSHFGVTSPDQRLQRPEYLGGGHTMINIRPVPQTSKSDVQGPDASPQGNLAAFGVGHMSGSGFTKSIVEHSLILGFVVARADLTYQQGLARMWSRRTKFDHYWPELAHLGEQAVLNQEIFYQGEPGEDADQDQGVFGYQERFAELRYKPSQVVGEFRSDSPIPLDTWHLAQDFEELPVLGAEFIEEDPPIDRVIAVPSEPHFIFDAYFNYNHVRPLPTYSIPGHTGRF